MQLHPGDKLGPYEILEPIGKGGMGEVWKARDTRLDRIVAIKTSKQQFSERFEREARAVAALNHPNICTLHDVGPNYLVMEFVEGAPLVSKEKPGPLPLDEVLRLGHQLSAALEAAHEKHITHRDLKPGNIMLKPDGSIKVLDFGLAKITAPARTDLPVDESPTLTMGMTDAGMILGTAAYMSPEQAKGKDVDKRADIWAFGVVIYELATGSRPFHGTDMSEILASVIKEHPNYEPVPYELRRLLKKCLEKDPAKRLRDIGDVWELLEAPPAAIAEPAPAPPAKRSVFPWAVAAVLTLAATALAFVHFRETPPQQQTTRYSITTPENSNIHSFALSPDGRTLVMAATVSGKRQLYLRPMDALQFQPMAFTEEATYPFWSPDSRFIGFFAQGKLKKVAASGGPSLALCDAPDGTGGSWNRDDVIVFAGLSAISIQRVPAAGGVPADVVQIQGGLVRVPVFLPDGRHFLYTIRAGTAEQVGIYVASLDQKGDGKENRRILPDVSPAQFAPPERSGQPSHLLFVRQNTLMAVPFDVSSAQVSGDVFPLADGVGVEPIFLNAPITVSENGVVLYRTGGIASGAQLAWMDRTGKQLGLVGTREGINQPAISPDEKQVAFARGDLWVRDLSRETETRFTTDASSNFTPFWSPKGDRIAFSSTRKGGVFNLYSKAANGGGQDELLLQGSVNDQANQWSRDGRFLVFYRNDPKTKEDLWVLPMEGAAADRKPIPFLQSEFREFLGQLSPDSHWMAYTSLRSGRREVYVRPFPSGEGEHTISIAGGEQPRWRGDGKELFFVGSDGKMMAVPVKTSVGATSSFEAGTPAALFEAHILLLGATTLFQYDVTSDGKRFLIATTGTDTASTPPLTVVTNWQAGVKK